MKLVLVLVVVVWVTVNIVGLMMLYRLWHKRQFDPCKQCKYLERIGGDNVYKYQCRLFGLFDDPPKICNRRKEKDW